MEPLEFKTEEGHIYATIVYDEELNALADTWIGPFKTQANFKKVLITIVDLFTETGANKWLADLRLMEGSFEASSAWLVNEIMPRAIANGLDYEAIVLPKDLYAKLTTVDAITRIRHVEIKRFVDMEEAREWLMDKTR
jgi:hypothetical protein